MKKLRTPVIAALLLSAGMLSATAASANSYALGTLNNSPIFGVNQVSHGSFIDFLNFTIGSDPSVTGGVLNFPIVIPIGPSIVLYDISGFTGQLFNGSNASGGSLSSAFSIGPTGWATSGALAPGNYSLELTGTGTGLFGGSYSYYASAVAVPEPGEWALMLAGIGMLGFIVRRRKET